MEMTLEGPEKEVNLEHFLKNLQQKKTPGQSPDDKDGKAGVWLLTGSAKKRRKGEMETVDGNGTSTETSSEAHGEYFFFLDPLGDFGRIRKPTPEISSAHLSRGMVDGNGISTKTSSGTHGENKQKIQKERPIDCQWSDAINDNDFSCGYGVSTKTSSRIHG